MPQCSYKIADEAINLVHGPDSLPDNNKSLNIEY